MIADIVHIKYPLNKCLHVFRRITNQLRGALIPYVNVALRINSEDGGIGSVD